MSPTSLPPTSPPPATPSQPPTAQPHVPQPPASSTPAQPQRRLSFRAKLAMLIAAVFITGSSTLLIVQFFLVQRLIDIGVEEMQTTVTAQMQGLVPHTVLGSGTHADGVDVAVLAQQLAHMCPAESILILWDASHGVDLPRYVGADAPEPLMMIIHDGSIVGAWPSVMVGSGSGVDEFAVIDTVVTRSEVLLTADHYLPAGVVWQAELGSVDADGSVILAEHMVTVEYVTCVRPDQANLFDASTVNIIDNAPGLEITAQATDSRDIPGQGMDQPPEVGQVPSNTNLGQEDYQWTIITGTDGAHSADHEELYLIHVTALEDALTQAVHDVEVRQTTESVIRTTTQISDSVMHQLLIWSIVVLGGFIVLAIAAAWWLSQRSLGRVAAITTTARSISHDDLSRRLNLPGPHDEIKELGDTFDSMMGRIHDAFIRQDRFIAGASHELRTPLTTTRTLLEMNLDQGRIPADIREDIVEALTANQRSEAIIAALLTLARSSRPRGSGTGTGIGLGSGTGAGGSGDGIDALLAPVTDMADVVAECGFPLPVGRPDSDSSATGAAMGPAGLPSYDAVINPDLACIAVGNLIDNARRYGRPDTVAVTVDRLVTHTAGSESGTGKTSRSQRPDSWRKPGWLGRSKSSEHQQASCTQVIVVEVENQGEDLTQQDVSEFVEPFHRGAKSRLSVDPGALSPVVEPSHGWGENALSAHALGTGGLGLGLALVDTIARAAGGSVTLQARPLDSGGGLRVRLVLPAAAAPVVDPGQQGQELD